jgi:streptomycin 6-kinase
MEGMRMTLVPENFVIGVRELYGHQGDEWLRGLPELLDRCVSRFCVSLEAPFPNLSWNLILKAAKHDGTPVVLKIAVLKADLSRELSALHCYAGRGGIQVIDADDNLGALVLERAEPGTPLSTIEDDNLATEIFCNVFQRLHCPPSTGQYVSIKDHFLGLNRYRHRFEDDDVIGPLPTHWVERARECLAYLISSTNESVLLHGDLHHDNILRHKGNEWAVIDPKGIVGDRHFDTIQYLLNYEERGGDPYTVLHRRIDIIADDLSLDPCRIAMWGIARGVLEACWTIEDGRTDWDKGIQITERFARYLVRTPLQIG